MGRDRISVDDVTFDMGAGNAGNPNCCGLIRPGIDGEALVGVAENDIGCVDLNAEAETRVRALALDDGRTGALYREYGQRLVDVDALAVGTGLDLDGVTCCGGVDRGLNR